MTRAYGAFLIRYWRLRGAERRIEIEHIQSGGRTRVRSLGLFAKRPRTNLSSSAGALGTAALSGSFDRGSRPAKTWKQMSPSAHVSAPGLMSRVAWGSSK